MHMTQSIIILKHSKLPMRLRIQLRADRFVVVVKVILYLTVTQVYYRLIFTLVIAQTEIRTPTLLRARSLIRTQTLRFNEV